VQPFRAPIGYDFFSFKKDPANCFSDDEKNQIEDLDIMRTLRLDLIEIHCKYNYNTFSAIPRHIIRQYAHKLPPVLLAAIYALSSIYQPAESGQVPRKDGGLEFYAHARKLVDEHTESPSPLVVYGLCLLVTYSVITGKCRLF
jgi:hypothetical protein